MNMRGASAGRETEPVRSTGHHHHRPGMTGEGYTSGIYRFKDFAVRS